CGPWRASCSPSVSRKAGATWAARSWRHSWTAGPGARGRGSATSRDVRRACRTAITASATAAWISSRSTPTRSKRRRPAKRRTRVAARTLRRWQRGQAGLARAASAKARAAAAARLEQAELDIGLALRALEEALVDLPEGGARTALLDAVASIEATRDRWHAGI